MLSILHNMLFVQYISSLVSKTESVKHIPECFKILKTKTNNNNKNDEESLKENRCWGNPGENLSLECILKGVDLRVERVKGILSSEASMTGNRKCSCSNYGGEHGLCFWNSQMCSVPSLTSVWAKQWLQRSLPLG